MELKEFIKNTITEISDAVTENKKELNDKEIVVNSEKIKIIPIEEETLYFLFRRGTKEHIEALYEKGEIYINTIDFIRKCDDNEERADKDDSIKYRKYIDNAQIEMFDFGTDSQTTGLKMSAENLVLKEDNINTGNIYCFSKIYSEDLIGERNDIVFNTEKFGDYSIVIHSPTKFLEKIFKELDRLGYKNYKANKIIYYNNEYSGKVNFFKKHEKHKSQKEFRVFIPNNKNKPIKFNIGSLKDIASINTEVIKLTYTDSKEQMIHL